MTNFSRLRVHFRRASADLDVEIREDHEIQLASGYRMVVPIFVPSFGGKRGTVVVSDLGEIEGHADELVNEGYGYSVLDEPSEDEAYACDVFIDVLSDWGWSGSSSARPRWMRFEPTS